MGGTNVFSLLGKLAIDGVDETKKALDDVSKSGEDTKKKLNVSFQDIGNKAGELGKKMAIGLGAVATGLIAGVESSREFRQDWGKLQTTFQTTGSSANTAKEVFKEFYGLLGEDDTSIEASNHLAQMTNNQKDLKEWTDICTGVYAKFGDSLPLEGLTEAANETIKVGKVTGPLADALNWATMSSDGWANALGKGSKAHKAFTSAINEGLPVEDAFNAALATTNSESEREQMTRKALNGLYSESSSTFKEMNKDIIDGNKAQADLSLQFNETMNKLEPLLTKGKLFIAEVLLKMQPAITWVIDNINILAPIILTFMGSLFALNIASKIMNFIPILKLLFTTISANPIVLVITLIVGAIALLIANWDKVKEVTIKVWEAIKQAISKAVDVIKNVITKVFEGIKKFIQLIWDGIKLYFTTVFNIYKTIFTTAFNAIKTVVTTVINAIKKVIETIFNAIKTYITTVLNVYKTIFTTVWNGIKTAVSKVVNGIKSTVSSVFNSLKSVVTTVWNGIKNAITKPIEKARDIIKGIVDKIKGFFKFNISLPKIKMPHFSISPSGWKIGDLLKGSIPKLGIDWYAKAVKNPMLLEDPTAFGFSPSGNIRVGGEAGSEIVGGTNTIMGMISDAVSSNNGGMEQKLDRLINLLTNYLPVLSEKQVVLSTGELVGAMVNPMDKALAEKTEDRRRGR